MKEDPHKDLKTYLAQIEPSELVSKINNFRNLNYNELTEEQLRIEFNNVLKVDCATGTNYVTTPRLGTYPKDKFFYRVRAIDDDVEFPLNIMRTESDAWNPPADKVDIKPGRLNKAGESLLYTALNKYVAIDEMNIKENKYFFLIRYKAKEPIKVSIVGYSDDLDGLNKVENFKLQLIDSFIKEEFTRDVGVGTEYLYKVSEFLAKDYFDLPSDWQDAFCYPSVAKKPNYNVCFRPDKAKKLLELDQVLLSRFERKDDAFLIKSKIKMLEFDKNGEFIYLKFTNNK